MTATGYDLVLIDSNAPTRKYTYSYTHGDKGFYQSPYAGSFVTYVEFDDEEREMQEIIKQNCGVSKSKATAAISEAVGLTKTLMNREALHPYVYRKQMPHILNTIRDDNSKNFDNPEYFINLTPSSGSTKQK